MKRRYKILGAVFAFIAVTLLVFMRYLSHDGECRAPEPLAANTATMKAIVYRCYGGPEVLKLEDIAKPAVADDRVLVKVRAAAVNPLDWHYMRGLPYVMRGDVGVGAPKDIRMGVDFAGTVEAVGRNVKRFKAGDEVFGGVTGSFAEYVSLREDRAIALKPPNISFEQAAGVGIAGVTALQVLRDTAAIKPGQRVLVNGASGGVGTFAVQIAKSMGAEVTAVCSTRNVEMVRALGADHVIDYTREDFTKGSQSYDLIFDNVGNRDLSELRRVTAPKGAVVMVGGSGGGKFLGPLGDLLRSAAYSLFVSQKFTFLLAQLNQKDLDAMRELMQAGKVTPVIDRSYPLAETAAAIAYLEEGHARGKVIIAVAP
jgi:NADPH:quinone reductase-like Zn-dependent oxidoreductase